MQKKIKYILAVAVPVAIIAAAFFAIWKYYPGTKSDSGSKPASANEINADDRLSKVVFCVIDGEELTAADVRDEVLLTAKIQELRGRKIPPSLFKKWGNSFAMRTTPKLILSRLWEKEINRIGVSPTASSDAEMLSNYNKIFNSNASSKEELAEKFGDLKQVFLNKFNVESQRFAYFRTVPELNVTDDDVEVYYLNLTNTINALKKLDVEGREKGAKAFERLQKGEDWLVVAKECSEDALLDKSFADNYKHWGCFKLGDIQPEELGKAVLSLKPGQWTSPIETDEGLVIVKLFENNSGTVSLARILFRLPIRVVVPDREKAVLKIRQEKEIEFQKENADRLRESHKIEYPLGKKFKYKIWSVEKKQKPKKADRAERIRALREKKAQEGKESAANQTEEKPAAAK